MFPLKALIMLKKIYNLIVFDRIPFWNFVGIESQNEILLFGSRIIEDSKVEATGIKINYIFRLVEIEDGSKSSWNWLHHNQNNLEVKEWIYCLRRGICKLKLLIV
jgi:hypothetical protein